MVNEDGLDIPAFLKISAEERAQARRDWKGFPNQPKAAVADNGPGAVCRRAGIPDGINQEFVAAVKAREAAAATIKKEASLAKLAAWKAEQAESAAVRAAARAQHLESLNT
jgi:hypothetical protein